MTSLSRLLFAALFVASLVPAVAAPLTNKLPDETAELKPGLGVENAIICLCLPFGRLLLDPAAGERAGLLGPGGAEDDQSFQRAY